MKLMGMISMYCLDLPIREFLISVVTAVAYAKLYGKEVRYCSDRKEEKDHGADKGGFLEVN